MSTETKTAPASLGFDDEFESMDVSAWTPNTAKNDQAPAPKRNTKAVKKSVEAAAQAVGFTSREPKAEPIAEPEGQINIKATLSSIEAFRDLSKGQKPKWPQGYTFERAIAALERELAEG